MVDIKKAVNVLDLMLTTAQTSFSETEAEAIRTAVELLKEQETEIRQLKLALDIAKGTCNGIVFETDEKFMGD